MRYNLKKESRIVKNVVAFTRTVLFGLCVVFVMNLYGDKKFRDYQRKVEKFYDKFDDSKKLITENYKSFLSHGKADAADIILSLNTPEFSSHSKKCESLAHGSHQTPKLSDSFLLEIKNSNENWLGLNISKELKRQLVWMDELEKYSGIYYFDSLFAECMFTTMTIWPINLSIIDKITRRKLSHYTDDFYAIINPIKPEFYRQVYGWIKIALIFSLEDEDTAKKSAKRVIHLIRVLLNSDQRFIHEAGVKSLGLIWHYIESPLAQGSAKFFPTFKELVALNGLSRTFTTMVTEYSDKSRDYEIFNSPGLFPGKCAALSQDLTSTLYLLGIGSPPLKGIEHYKNLFESSLEECPLKHLRSKFMAIYLTNKKLKSWESNLRFLKSPWYTFEGSVFNLGSKLVLDNKFNENINKLESIYN